MSKEGHGGNLAAAAERYDLPPEEFVDFSSNINPLGIPRRLKGRLKKNLSEVTRYPDPHFAAARRGLSDYLGVPAENVLVTNGGAEAIQLAVNGEVRRDQRARGLIVNPTFSEYGGSLRRAGGEAVNFTTKPPDFHLCIEELLRFFADNEGKRNLDLLFFCNPNNPTGQVVGRARLERLWERVKSIVGDDVKMVVDEAFVDFLPREERVTLRKRASDDRGLIVVGSLTKMFALPGLRIGYLVGHEKTVDRLEKIQIPWSVNGLAQLAATQVPYLTSFVARTRRFIKEEREFLCRQLEDLQVLRVFPSRTNYILVEVGDRRLSATKLKDFLGRRGYLIRCCDNFLGLDEQFFRLAVKSREANEGLLALMREFFL